MKKLVHQVPDSIDKRRITDYLPGIFDALPSKSSVKKALKRCFISINGEIADTANWIKPGDQIELSKELLATKPVYERKLEILYEDDFLAIVNKPAGILTRGNSHQTLENALPFNLDMSRTLYARPVHRLDRATSGLLIIAKEARIAAELGKLFENGEVKKTYHAILTETIAEYQKIEIPVDNKPAVSEIRLKTTSNNGRYYLVELKPQTGRTHQLRIHCASLGSPILGDPIYGDKTVKKGLFLCATGLSFKHPETGKDLNVTIDIPNKFERILNR